MKDEEDGDVTSNNTPMMMQVLSPLQNICVRNVTLEDTMELEPETGSIKEVHEMPSRKVVRKSRLKSKKRLKSAAVTRPS